MAEHQNCFEELNLPSYVFAKIPNLEKEVKQNLYVNTKMVATTASDKTSTLEVNYEIASSPSSYLKKIENNYLADNSADYFSSASQIDETKELSFKEMIFRAILACNRNVICTLQDIYRELTQQFPGVVHSGAWKNTVCQTLYENECFLMVPHGDESRERYYSWMIHPHYLPRLLKGDVYKEKKLSLPRRNLKRTATAAGHSRTSHSRSSLTGKCHSTFAPQGCMTQQYYHQPSLYAPQSYYSRSRSAIPCDFTHNILSEVQSSNYINQQESRLDDLNSSFHNTKSDFATDEDVHIYGVKTQTSGLSYTFPSVKSENMPKHTGAITSLVCPALSFSSPPLLIRGDMLQNLKLYHFMLNGCLQNEPPVLHHSQRAFDMFPRATSIDIPLGNSFENPFPCFM